MRGELRRAFDAAYRTRFAFVVDRSVVVEAVAVEAIGHMAVIATPELAVRAASPVPPLEPADDPHLRRRAPQQPAAARTPVFERDALARAPRRRSRGHRRADDHGRGEPGWRATVRRATSCCSAAARRAAPHRLDARRPGPARGLRQPLHVDRRADGRRLRTPPYSTNIKERLDFSCAVFDRDGGWSPTRRTSRCTSARWARACATCCGAPRSAAPGRRVRAQRPVRRRLAPARRHRGHAGVRPDGRAPVSSPRAAAITPTSAASRPARCRRTRTSLDEEGVLLDDLAARRATGAFHAEELVRCSRRARIRRATRARTWPTWRPRSPPTARASGELLRRWSASSASTWCAPTWGTCRTTPRSRCAGRSRLPDGRHASRTRSTTARRSSSRVRIDRAARRVPVDFTGTGAQLADNLNAPRAVTVAAVLYVLRTLVGEPIPLNAGCLRAGRAS